MAGFDAAAAGRVAHCLSKVVAFLVQETLQGAVSMQKKQSRGQGKFIIFYQFFGGKAIQKDIHINFGPRFNGFVCGSASINYTGVADNFAFFQLCFFSCTL